MSQVLIRCLVCQEDKDDLDCVACTECSQQCCIPCIIRMQDINGRGTTFYRCPHCRQGLYYLPDDMVEGEMIELDQPYIPEEESSDSELVIQSIQFSDDESVPGSDGHGSPDLLVDLPREFLTPPPRSAQDESKAYWMTHGQVMELDALHTRLSAEIVINQERVDYLRGLLAHVRGHDIAHEWLARGQIGEIEGRLFNLQTERRQISLRLVYLRDFLVLLEEQVEKKDE